MKDEEEIEILPEHRFEDPEVDEEEEDYAIHSEMMEGGATVGTFVDSKLMRWAIIAIVAIISLMVAI